MALTRMALTEPQEAIFGTRRVARESKEAACESESLVLSLQQADDYARIDHGTTDSQMTLMPRSTPDGGEAQQDPLEAENTLLPPKPAWLRSLCTRKPPSAFRPPGFR